MNQLNNIINRLMISDPDVKQVITDGSSNSKVYLIEQDNNLLNAIRIDRSMHVSAEDLINRYYFLKMIYPENSVDLIDSYEQEDCIISIISAPSTYSLFGLIKNNVLNQPCRLRY